MGVMDIFAGFRGTGNSGSNNQAANAGGNPPPNVDDNKMVPNGTTPQNKEGTGPGAIPKAGEGEKSPLENYKDLWQKDDKNDGKEPNLVPTFTVDSKKLMEAAGTVDFVKGIDPTLIENAAKGDKDALAAVVNKAAQLGFAHSSASTAKIVETALRQQAEKFSKEVMPHILRQNEISRSLREDNELFSNPAVAPLLEMTEKQFAIKYPKASAQEVTTKAKEYVREFAEAVVKSSGGTVSKTTTDATKKSGLSRGDTDWEMWFNGDTSKAS